MMRKKRFIIIFLALLILATGVLAVSLDYRARDYAIGSGSVLVSGGSFEAYGTIGQPVVGLPLSGGNYRVVSGFWSFAQGRQDLVFLPAVLVR